MHLLILLLGRTHIDRDALFGPGGLQRLERFKARNRHFGTQLGTTVVERDATQLRTGIRGETVRQMSEER